MLRLFLLFSLLAFRAGAAENRFAVRHVSVRGTSITRVQPDTIVWDITIKRTNRELAKAREACEESLKKVLDLRPELNLKAEDVQTGYLSIRKIFDRDQAGNQLSFRHFEVVRSVTMRQRDTSRFNNTLTRLTEAAEAEVSYQLESSEYHELRAKTRLAAVRAAREKATAMTELLGGKLGRVLRIAEPEETWSSLYNSFSNSAQSAPRQSEPDEATGTFAPGAIEIRVSIDVDFEIE